MDRETLLTMPCPSGRRVRTGLVPEGMKVTDSGGRGYPADYDERWTPKKGESVEEYATRLGWTIVPHEAGHTPVVDAEGRVILVRYSHDAPGWTEVANEGTAAVKDLVQNGSGSTTVGGSRIFPKSVVRDPIKAFQSGVTKGPGQKEIGERKTARGSKEFRRSWTRSKWRLI